MKHFTHASMGAALIVGLALHGCGDDEPYRPPVLDDIGGSLGDGFEALDGGAGDSGPLPDRVDVGTVDAFGLDAPKNPTDNGGVAPADNGGVAPADNGVVAPTDNGSAGFDSGVGPTDLDGGVGPADNGAVVGPTDLGGGVGPADNGAVVGPADLGP